MTPDKIPAVLGEFQQWLETLATAPSHDTEAESSTEETIDLATLLGQMTAIRQETNLLTKATRTQQDQNQETLAELASALQALRQSQAGSKHQLETSLEEQARPLLRTLVDLYDILLLSTEQIERTRDTVLPKMEAALEAMTAREYVPIPPAPEPEPIPWYAFWRKPVVEEPMTVRLREILADDRRFHEETFEQTREALTTLHARLSALLDGYRLSLQRVLRTLGQHQLEAMEVVGEPFDPELMEVVEVVHEGDYAAGEVVEEVSRGYLWQGRVFRYAKVRVAKP